MTELVKLDHSRIVFAKARHELQEGAFFVTWGLFAIVFSAIGIIATWRSHSLVLGLFCIPFVIWGPRILARGLYELASPEWMSFDLKGRTYQARRGLLRWAERLKGTFHDFDYLCWHERPIRGKKRGYRLVLDDRTRVGE